MYANLFGPDPQEATPDPYEPTKCPTCNGVGILSDSKWGDAIGSNCHTCEGVGYSNYIRCPECSGKGCCFDIDPTNDLLLTIEPCVTCNGEGFYPFNDSPTQEELDDYSCYVRDFF